MVFPGFDALSDAFLAAFRSQSGAFFHDNISITDLRSQGKGRAIVATADIPPETDLFTIPRDYVISVSNSDLVEKIPEVFEDHDDISSNEAVDDSERAMSELPKPWLDLILVLIYEFLHHDTSKWKAYWDVLPEKFDTLMFWSDTELSELQKSAAREKIGKDDADEMFRTKILPVVKLHKDVFYPKDGDRLSDEDLLQLAHRMGSLIMAYAFDLESDNIDDDENEEDGWTEDKEGKMAMGMVPMADMLNADAEFNAHLEHGEAALTMRSLREIKRGEEVLNYYGPLPNADLLRRYGYTSAKHARYDVVEISWATVKQALEEVLGAVPAVDGDEDLEESFVLERESGDPDETGLNSVEPKFTTFPEELVEQTTAIISAALKTKVKSKGVQERHLKQKFLQAMAKTIQFRLGGYDTTVEQDEKLLQSASAVRTRMAIDVRMGEKQLLKEADHLVTELLQKYSGVQEPSTMERPSKKQKTK